MRVFQGIIQEELLAYGSPNLHKGYVVVLVLTDNLKQIALINPSGKWFKKYIGKFVGKVCNITGTLVGLTIHAKLIVDIEDETRVWTI